MSALITAFTAFLTVPVALAAPATIGMPMIVARNTTQSYSGPASSFPSMDTWTDFGTIQSVNKANALAKGDTESDWENIGKAVKEVASSEGLDERVILSMIVQESTGYVGVETTTDTGTGTGGLMQATGCTGYPGQSNLSYDQIKEMISCGTDHFKSNYQSEGGSNDAATYYSALRVYNSGSISDESDLSSPANGATSSYVSDMANRLQGNVV